MSLHEKVRSLNSTLRAEQTFFGQSVARLSHHLNAVYSDSHAVSFANLIDVGRNRLKHDDKTFQASHPAL